MTVRHGIGGSINSFQSVIMYRVEIVDSVSFPGNGECVALASLIHFTKFQTVPGLPVVIYNHLLTHQSGNALVTLEKKPVVDL